MKKGTILIMFLLATMFAFSSFVSADPIGADGGVTEIGSSTRDHVFSPYNSTAIAGNVTEMNIDAITVTNYWQGYYGNITGSIVLANSNNDTLYDWSITDSSGQVYASRADSITWASILCADSTQITAEDTAIGSTGKTDAINETFLTSVNHNVFSVGITTIDANTCAASSLHNSTGVKEDLLFSNVILYDGSNAVYTSIINNDATGFDNKTHDFQLIVPEDGTNDNTDVTNYYFWVELV